MGQIQPPCRRGVREGLAARGVEALSFSGAEPLTIADTGAVMPETSVHTRLFNWVMCKTVARMSSSTAWIWIVLVSWHPFGCPDDVVQTVSRGT